MSSSISSSDWRWFARRLIGTGLGLMASVYLFVLVIDPWNVLPLSPPLPRVPISTNARFSFPALARSPAFDSLVLGTSTARLLRPAQLNLAFGGHFANLAMNSATAWEQMQLLQLFLRTHPTPKTILIGLDGEYCGDTAPETTPRPFPRWMYQGSPWAGYQHMLTPYAVQEATNQLTVMLGLQHRRYGPDGYTSFVPDDALYDPARVDAAFARWPALDNSPDTPGAPFALLALHLLATGLSTVPRETRVVLFFAPYFVDRQGRPGTRDAARWAACKAAARQLSPVIDLLVPSDVTRDRANYWDPLHYRVAIAARMVRVLAGEADPGLLPAP